MSNPSELVAILWAEWLRVLFETWREKADVETEAEWSKLLGIGERTPRTWREKVTGQPQPLLLANMVNSLYELTRGSLGVKLPLRPSELLDWLVLLGYMAPASLALPIGEDTQNWLKQAISQPEPWPVPPLSVNYVEREITDHIVELLVTVRGYRRPWCRVVVLHGPAGSGKSHLAAVLTQKPGVKAWFRNGAWWLGRRKSLNTKVQKWFSSLDTVGLIVVDDLRNPELLDYLLPQIGPQMQVLIITQSATRLRQTLSTWVADDEINWVAIDKLSPTEARELYLKRFGQKIATEDEQYFEWVRREAGWAASMNWLMSEAKIEGWSRVWDWLQQQYETPLVDGWDWLDRAWQQLALERQVWVRQLASNLTSGHSFGVSLAAFIWREQEKQAEGRLQILVRLNWIEEIDETSWGTPTNLAQLMARPRYRLAAPVAILALRGLANTTEWNWLRRQQLLWRLGHLLYPSVEASIAVWLIVIMSPLWLIVGPIVLLSGRGDELNRWAGGRLWPRLAAGLAPPPGWQPAEVTLLQEARRLNYVVLPSLLVGLAALHWAGVKAGWLVGNLWGIATIYLFLALLWVIREWLAWPLHVMLLYDIDPPQEILLVRWLFQKLRLIRKKINSH